MCCDSEWSGLYGLQRILHKENATCGSTNQTSFYRRTSSVFMQFSDSLWYDQRVCCIDHSSHAPTHPAFLSTYIIDKLYVDVIVCNFIHCI